MRGRVSYGGLWILRRGEPGMTSGEKRGGLSSIIHVVWVGVLEITHPWHYSTSVGPCPLQQQRPELMPCRSLLSDLG